MPDKSLIIIGAGLAGLSAGCYGRMNGYRVQIFEQDTRPGGLVTSWERKGYTIHGNMAFLAGSGPGVAFHRIWQELGVVPKTRMIEYEYFLVYEGRDGKTFFMDNDIDKLEKRMKEISPEDEDVIDDFARGVRTFARYEMPMNKAQELLGPADKIKLLITKFPLLRAMNKWKKITVKDFAHSFKNPLLRCAFLEFGKVFSEDLPMVLLAMAFAWGYKKSCGFPAGGALEFSRSIERRFLELGGRVQYLSAVTKILVQNDQAVGIRLADGREVFADYVISAADGRTTIFDMLDGKYADAKIRHYYNELPVSASAIIVGLGVARSFLELPWSSAGWIYYLDEPVVIGGKKFEWLRPMIYNFDLSLAPPGKTFIRLLFPADYDYWNELRQKPERYKAEKEKIASTIISLLDRRYPGLASQVEMWDVATPLTFERHTGNWKGSMLGWELTRKTIFMPMKKTLPGLKNFFMAGHWVEPGGGIPMVALSGRNVIQLICRQDKKKFVTSL
jgi:phytoene dehydrogenase-like protein